jgi:hypothetical protein
VITNYRIPADALLFCGMSLAGTRALKMAAFAQSEHSTYHIQPKALAICDAPLDMIRFFREGEKAAKLNYQAAAANEGAWTTAYLRANLGGTPGEVRTAYEKYSPYCYAADDGGNAHYFQNIALRAYTEPDVQWWMETRRKDQAGPFFFAGFRMVGQFLEGGKVCFSECLCLGYLDVWLYTRSFPIGAGNRIDGPVPKEKFVEKKSA